MSTSGTYTFNPGLGELTVYAYQLIGVRPTALLQEHMDSARLATNMMFTRWSNQGVNLWQVSLVTVPLVAGTATYSVDASTVVMLDAYIEYGVPPIDRNRYADQPHGICLIQIKRSKVSQLCFGLTDYCRQLLPYGRRLMDLKRA